MSGVELGGGGGHLQQVGKRISAHSGSVAAHNRRRELCLALRLPQPQRRDVASRRRAAACAAVAVGPKLLDEIQDGGVPPLHRRRHCVLVRRLGRACGGDYSSFCI